MRGSRLWRHLVRIPAEAHTATSQLSIWVFPIGLVFLLVSPSRRIDQAHRRARTRTVIAIRDTICSLRSPRSCIMFFPNPRIPQHPTHCRRHGTPADHRHRTDSLLDNADETADKDNHRRNMLNNDRRVRHKGPKIVRTHPWIPLEMVQEGLSIGIVIRICRFIRSCVGQRAV